MPQNFLFDVFLSHSSKDKVVARALAERLRSDGLRVWFNEWELKPGDSFTAKIEEGLEHSRVLMLCMSANAFGSDWAELESQTFPFRDPQNKARRFVPVRLDDAPIEDSIAQFLYINWRPDVRDDGYQNLLEACTSSSQRQQHDLSQVFKTSVMSLGHVDGIRSVAWSPNGEHALSGAADYTIRLWEIATGHCIQVFEGHSDSINWVAWSPNGQQALSASEDNTVRLWEIATGDCLRVFEGHTNSVWTVGWSFDGERAISGSADDTLRLWDIASGRCLRVFKGHSNSVTSLAWSPDGQQLLTSSCDKTVRLWEIESGRCLNVFRGHNEEVWTVAWNPDGGQALSGGSDKTLRLWDTASGRCLKVLEGHGNENEILSVAWRLDGKQALSGADDNTIRLWDIASSRCLHTFEGHNDRVLSVAWSPNGEQALSGSDDNTVRLWDIAALSCQRIFEGHSADLNYVAWCPDRLQAVSAADDNTVRLWDIRSARCLHIFEGHNAGVNYLDWSPNGQQILSASVDKTLRLWDIATRRCLRVFEGHSDDINCVTWSPDGHYALSGADDNTVRVWEISSGLCLQVFEGHSADVNWVAWSPNGQDALSSADDNAVRLWEISSGHCLRIFEGHSDSVWSLAWSPSGQHFLSCAADHTLRLWEVASGRCLRVFEGHSGSVNSVAWSPDGKYALSGAYDTTIRVWDVSNGRCLEILEGHSDSILSVAWSVDNRVFSGAANGVIRVWNVPARIVDRSHDEFHRLTGKLHGQLQYTNAKVLIVGDSGVGKTGLSNYLAHSVKVEDEKPTLSTDGAWATRWPLSHAANKVGIDREIWLWDFAGQVDYRLVHQLFMDYTAAAVLVFNPQNENPFEGLSHWDNDLMKATRKAFGKVLVGARIDRGGLVVSESSIKKFMDDRSFRLPLHLTSAKTGEGCETLRNAIIESIDWQSIPETTSPALYYRIKHEILKLRDTGVVLIRLAELKQHMELALRGENFKLAELNSVVNLLSGPGIIQGLDFGGFILLRPEVFSRYAAAVVRKVRQHPQEIGCIREDELLAGNLEYQDFERIGREDEAVVLRALLETFINRAWCLRQIVDDRVILTFPSYFRRERKQQPSHPSVLVTYRFDGHTDEIYATLVVRLHHTKAFESQDLWRSAADFRTQTGAALGFTIIREAEGTSRLEVYFQPDVDEDSRLLFLRYVHDHLSQHVQNLVRLRHYFCSTKKCKRFNQPFMDRLIIDETLSQSGAAKVYCPACGKPINLRDVIEQKFESPAIKEKAREMKLEGQAVIDSESRELILVGHAFSIVAEAGQIYRGYTNSDHGVDGEIEFKDDSGRATGKKLYLQLKSGNSYLKKRQRDEKEIFSIKNVRWSNYWQQHAYTVMLVVRTSDGEIRWMDVTTYLKRESENGKKEVKQIVFDGERFDVMSVRRWRDKLR